MASIPKWTGQLRYPKGSNRPTKKTKTQKVEVCDCPPKSVEIVRWTDGEVIAEGASVKAAAERKRNLNGADLSGTDLDGANLYRSKLRNAYLGNVFAPNADFRYSDLRNIDAKGADFSGADFEGANAYKASFKEARLEKADFRVSNLEGADFRESVLTGANFAAANIHRADFRDAKDAELSGSHGKPILSDDDMPEGFFDSLLSAFARREDV